MQGQYDILKHSILPLVYKIIGPNHHISYLLKDPATKSLLLFNPLFNTLMDKNYSQDTEDKHFKWLISHIHNIQSISQSKLSHIISNHSKFKDQYTKLSLALEKYQNRKNVKLLLPNPSESAFNIKPELVGEVSVCFIPAQGYYSDYSLIGVTHISQRSTKVPVLFVEDLIRVSSINYEYFNHQITDEGYLKSLSKVKYFPNQTYIFPSRLAQRADLLFAKAMVSNSKQSSKALSLLEEKIKIFEKNNLACPDCLIPTTVYEEKHLNPFMQADKYGQLLGIKVKDSGKIFKLLSEIRKQWKM